MDENQLFGFVVFCGFFGGALYFLQHLENEIQINNSRIFSRKNIISFICDSLFGIAGGILIFIVLPCVPIITNELNKGWDILKIMGLAIAGGYGGRLLVEKVSSEQFKKLEAKIDINTRSLQEIENRTNAINLAEQWMVLGERIEVSLTKEKFLKLDSETRFKIFERLDGKRYDTVFELLGESRHNPEEKLNHQRKLFRRLIPPIEVIKDIEYKEDQKSKNLNKYYSRLAYLYKDSRSPIDDDFLKDMKSAEYFINLAIDSRPKNTKSKEYEKNRVIILINLGKTDSEEFSNDYVALKNDKDEWEDFISMDPVLAPNVKEWLYENKKDDYEIWEKNHR